MHCTHMTIILIRSARSPLKRSWLLFRVRYLFDIKERHSGRRGNSETFSSENHFDERIELYSDSCFDIYVNHECTTLSIMCFFKLYTSIFHVYFPFLCNTVYVVFVTNNVYSLIKNVSNFINVITL